MRKLVLIATLLFLYETSKAADVFEVKMLNKGKSGSMVFEPGLIKIKPGDKITFLPTDKSHNPQSVFIPKGAKPWKGEDDKKLSLSFEKEGLYIFECKNHKVMGMVGILQVGKPTNLEESKKFIEKYQKKIPMNKGRLKAYLAKLLESNTQD